MSIFNRTITAFRAGYNAFTGANKSGTGFGASGGTASLRPPSSAGSIAFDESLAYYQKTAFSRRYGATWADYLRQRELYKHTRLIFNPVPSVVDFYVDNIWERAARSNSAALVTPVADGADENLLAAIAQLDQWTNWLTEQRTVKRFAAATGNCLVEIVDNLEREKITQKTHSAETVKDVELNDAGDVTAYTLEYQAYDRISRETYKFTKVVTKDKLRYFRNDAPFTPPTKKASVEENPYGFCPAVWFRHADNGTTWGAPAFDDLDKVDELNSLASHLHDNIHKEIESGKLIGVDDITSIKTLTGGGTNADGTITPTDPRNSHLLIAAKGQVNVSDLSGLLKLADAHPYLKDLILSFGADYPELEYRQIIKESAQLSGVALERLLTPAQNRLDRAAAGYDQQLIKLRQMQISIAGWRQSADWTANTEQQKVFARFNLDSYEKGELDFYLKRSLLVEQTEEEREDLLTKKAARAAVLASVVPPREQLLIAGYSEERADELMKDAPGIAPTPVIQMGEGK